MHINRFRIDETTIFYLFNAIANQLTEEKFERSQVFFEDLFFSLLL